MVRILIYLLILSIAQAVQVDTSQAAAATVYYVSSGSGPGSTGLVGDDSANCTSNTTPCLTVGGGLAKIYAEHGTSCADIKLLIMGGDYNLGNGLKRGSTNQFTALCSDTSDAHPFIIRAYKASDPTGDNSCDSDPTHPVAGQSSCLPVVWTRSGDGSKTVNEMQSVGGPQCGGQDCVGMPTDAECLAAYGTTDFHNCWSGAPNVPVYIFQNRAGGAVLLEAVVELYGLQVDHPDNKPKYVVFDGIACDARGIVSACYRTGQHDDHELMATHITWKNGYWINTNQSAMSQPGVSNGEDQVRPDYTRPCTPPNCGGGIPESLGYHGLSYEFLIDCSSSPCVQGARTSNHMLMKNFKISKVGSPFNTLRVDGTHSGSSPNRRDVEQAAFLHAFYLHTGGNTCDNCEISETAGFCFAPDGDDNHFINSYCHDADGGIQAFGVYQTVENSVFYNNGNTDIQSPAVGGGGTRDDSNRTVFRNNTHIHGPRGVYSNAIQLGNGSHANMIQNNVIVGYARGIEGTPCGFNGGSCDYLDRVVIQNNVFDDVTTPVAISGTDGTNVVLPACTLGGGAGTMSTCNKLNPAGGIKFASTTAPNYPLQSDSPAVDYGATNDLAKDYLGNTRPFNKLIDAGAFEYCTGGGCSAVPTTGAVSVNSTTSGVSISWTVSGGTCDAASPQSTSFTMACGLGSVLTLTAPLANFTVWSGCNSQASGVCTVTINGGTNLTANYGSVKNLTIATVNPGTGVTLGISPADLDGFSTCTAPCTRRFNSGQVVTIDAPDILGSGSFFSTWTNCSSPQNVPNYSDCHHSLDADITITATFGGTGCHIKKTIVPTDIITICPNQTINLYDDWQFSGQFIGTAEAGSVGTVTAGPFDFDSDSTYIYVDFVTNNTPCSPTPSCHPDGWLTNVNMFKAGEAANPIPKLLIGSGTVLIGSGKQLKVQAPE